ncbi:Fic family protein [Avibacterium paragallinarum]|uniref:Cell filamentation protein Fic n=1 Tax=Avibacterium paragallinarum TaxID=728 RepID=A0AAE5TLF3_AVIPA|nr:Fic family protein [Avibacterium paragallinarum]MEE3607716.1 Fic family protein [Avibacterium paragallinarum]MEE3620398.1 Fic family protein [Avibacterium paragallinarum]MEE3668419.1 Fic family protein [Avibacterium paragallinarum]MEE3680775.1 Fic family protein [Avibacterium paragallinarum]MEE4385522.1 Fic family protein [Avibacterium paragallinarum]
MMPYFQDFPLRLLNPSFDSDLIDVLTELEKLRTLRLSGDVHPVIFMQLKSIFHMLESLGSARIEGNHTTLADYVENHLDNRADKSEQLEEIHNIENAMHFIDENLKAGDKISEHFIRELHALTVMNLSREGDKTPGQYRKNQVAIAQSEHLPPEFFRVPDYMQELVEFINNDDKPKYDLMKIALAHHRFGWVHPFSNGNGRTVRLLTYALLVKYGFNVQTGGRVLNPTAVFCSDRNRYYEMLSIADKGTSEGLEAWCTYVLAGISNELQKVDKLTSKNFLNERILFPAIQYSQKRQFINEDEAKILRFAVDHSELKAGDLTKIIPSKNANQRTYQIKKLIDSGFISPLGEGARIYIPNFTQSYLIRGVIDSLRENGFFGGLD